MINLLKSLLFNKNMAYVYLITEENDSDCYKIGSTRKNDINERLKELQTGNSEKLLIANYFECDKPFKLEQMLHRHYRKYNRLNEWFNLSKEEVDNFTEVCKKYHNIIVSLKDNPFF